jgi:hypothetical protein
MTAANWLTDKFETGDQFSQMRCRLAHLRSFMANFGNRGGGLLFEPMNNVIKLPGDSQTMNGKMDSSLDVQMPRPHIDEPALPYLDGGIVCRICQSTHRR